MADAGPSDDTQTATETPFITPVIGTMSNEDVPAMRGLRDGGGSEVDAGKAGGEAPEEREVANPSGGRKRKQPDPSESEEEGEVDREVGSEELGTRRSLGSFAGVQKLDREREKGTTEDSKREDLGVKPLHEDLSLHFVSSLNREPMILLDRLPDSIGESSRAWKSPHARWPPQRRRKPDSPFPASDNKE